MSLTAVARRVAIASGLARPARRIREAFPNAGMRRDRRDNEHLRVVLAAGLASDSNCLDIGANAGGVLEQIVRLAPAGRHIAFEPLPALADDLKRRFPGVEVRRCALADQTGTAEFVHVVNRPGYSGLRERRYPGAERLERLTVEVARLDDVLDRDYRPALIKIDVEGAEREVIAGGLETIARHKPLVVFEHGLGAADYYGTQPEQIHELLVGGAGLRLFDLDGNGPLSRDEFAESFARAAIWNYLARP
jgi:FkbM family methyltransferase